MGQRQSGRSGHRADVGTRREGSRRKQNAADVFETIKAYARQELLDPLAGMPRWLALGLLGSVFVAIGIVLLLLALLRGLQTETGTAFTGSLSWVPYAAAMAATSLLTAVILRQIGKRSLS